LCQKKKDNDTIVYAKNEGLKNFCEKKELPKLNSDDKS
jgi:hypothetical protein